MEAFILANTESSALWQVVEDVLKVEGVKMAYGVTGQFDALVLVQFSDLDEIEKIVERIQHVKGVLRTQTLMASPPPARTASAMPSLSEEERTGPNGYPDR